MCAVTWGLYVEKQWGTYIQCDGHMPVEGMYTSAPGHTVNSTKWICNVYTDIVVLYQHKK